MKNVIFAALKNHADFQTQDALGDRQKYIGASDLASARSCLRKVAFSKAGLSVEADDMESLLTKQRGHWYEAGILEALHSAGKRVIPQLEIAFVEGGIQHNFHLDFVIVENDEIQVLELKTTRLEEAELQDSYEFQLRTQISALHRFRHQKAFRVHKSLPLVTFREVVRHLFDVEADNLPVTGHILVFSTKDKMESYGPYQPVGDEFWGEVTSLSRKIVLAAQQPEKADFAKGFYALCDYCSQQAGCPKFKAVEVASISPTLSKLFRVKDAIETLETAKKGLEESLKGYYGKVQSLLPKGLYLQCSAGKYKVSCASRKSYSEAAFMEALHGELEEITSVIEEIKPLISGDSDHLLAEKASELIRLLDEEFVPRVMLKAVRQTQQSRLTLVKAA